MAIKGFSEAQCVGCKKCIDCCPMDVFKWDEAQKRLVIAYQLDCITCFNCELNCPRNVLYVEPVRAKPVIFPW